MSREQKRKAALQRRQKINDQNKQHNGGTIMGQPDREKAPEKRQREAHEDPKNRLVKVVLSIAFTWILGLGFLIVTGSQLASDRESINDRWDLYLQSDEAVETQAQEIAKKAGATEVTCGTYLENLKEIDIKNSSWRSVWLVWFTWKGSDDIDFSGNQFIYYNGHVNSKDVIKDEVAADGTHYQQFRVDVSISQTYHTPRFPLENHLLRIYLEPTYDITEVILVPSDDCDAINKNINVTSYQIDRLASGMKYIEYADDHDDPAVPAGKNTIISEAMNEIEVNRIGWGLYVKCFIALWGTTLWVLIMLFVATRHRVDVFGMIPATLFGAVGNIMIGANLLPEAMNLGLLEYVNIWGIFMVLAGTVTITILNRERNHWHDNDFADKYGRFMFITILSLAIIGNLVLPLCSYQF